MITQKNQMIYYIFLSFIYNKKIKIDKNKKKRKFMKVGYAVLYENGTLVISKNYTILNKIVDKNYGKFSDKKIPWLEHGNKIKMVTK